jgi:PAS domain S-box-containing protein
VNEAWARLTRLDTESARGDGWLSAVAAEDREALRAQWRHMLDRGTPLHARFRLNPIDGSFRWARLEAAPERDASGEISGYVGALLDVTHTREVEEKLKAQVRFTEESNRELERFASVASHDLQEPLRMVLSYLKLLRDRTIEKLSSEEHEFLSFAMDGALRMRTLIHNLLSYSTVAHAPGPFTEVDCESVAHQVISTFRATANETNATISCDELPKVRGIAPLLEQLFQNLISNALKFRGKRAPQIRISAEPGTQGEWILSVRDNGIGIERESQSQLFKMFRRLQGREYPGTGIGLAICKRVVERHGGRLWVESEPGAGSVFRFTLHAPDARAPSVGAPS